MRKYLAIGLLALLSLSASAQTVSQLPVNQSSGSWTPTDNSGATLSLTSVSAAWTRIGNIIFAYGTFTYPATADGLTANISGLPFTVPNVAYAAQCSLTTKSISTLVQIVPTINATTFTFRNAAGGGLINSDLSLGEVGVMCIYPAT